MCEPTTIASIASYLGASAGTAGTIGTVGAVAANAGIAAYGLAASRRASQQSATALPTITPAAAAYRSPEKSIDEGGTAPVTRRSLRVPLAAPAGRPGLQTIGGV